MLHVLVTDGDVKFFINSRYSSYSRNRLGSNTQTIILCINSLHACRLPNLQETTAGLLG